MHPRDVDIIRDPNWHGGRWSAAGDLLQLMLERGVDLTGVALNLATNDEDDLLHNRGGVCPTRTNGTFTVIDAVQRLCGTCTTLPSHLEAGGSNVLDWAEDVAQNHLLLDAVGSALAAFDSVAGTERAKVLDRLVDAVVTAADSTPQGLGRRGSDVLEAWYAESASRIEGARAAVMALVKDHRAHLERCVVTHLADLQYPLPQVGAARYGVAATLHRALHEELRRPTRYLTVPRKGGSSGAHGGAWGAVEESSPPYPQGVRALILALAGPNGVVIAGPGVSMAMHHPGAGSYWGEGDAWQCALEDEDTDGIIETAAVLVREGAFETLDEALAAARVV